MKGSLRTKPELTLHTRFDTQWRADALNFVANGQTATRFGSSSKGLTQIISITHYGKGRVDPIDWIDRVG